MTRSARLLTALVVFALALPSSASLAQKGREKKIPGGPLFAWPDLTVSIENATSKCTAPYTALFTFTARVTNNGDGPAFMPKGQSWPGYWVRAIDMNSFSAPDTYASAPPWYLAPHKSMTFNMSRSVTQVCYWGNCSVGFTVHLLINVDPYSVIAETNEANNSTDYSFFYKSEYLCK